MKLKIAVAASLIISTIVVLSILLANLYLQQTTQSNTDFKVLELPSYSTSEISRHNIKSDCWLVVDQKVYNVTDFIPLHPGGAERIIPHCGQDASQAFATQGGEGQHSRSAENQLKTYHIGHVAK